MRLDKVFSSLLISSSLGGALALVINVPLGKIAGSERPLLLVFQDPKYEWIPKYFSLIALMAISNTGLINLIMASRLMYGMAGEGLLPKAFGTVHARRKTPWMGVLSAAAAVLLLVLTGSLKVLAQTTSFLILVVFLFVHLSLLKVKWRREPHEGIAFHGFFPIVGSLLCLGLTFTFSADVYLRSLILVGVGFLVWGLQTKTLRKA